MSGVLSLVLHQSKVATLYTQNILFYHWPCFGNIIFPLGKSSVSLLSHLESGCRCFLQPPPKSCGSLVKTGGQLRPRTEASQVAEDLWESTDTSAPETQYLWGHF